jgi:alkanesulfonate monooxygenase
VNYAGKHFRVEEASIPQKPDPLPPLYFGGSSAAAGPVAAKHSDVYLTWGEPVKQVAEKVAWIRGLADEEGRTVRFGIRLHVISRDSSAAAWAEADRLLAAIDPETIKNVQTGLARSESVGQKRMIELHKGSKENLKVGPNLWAGVGLVRGGAGTALVGSHSELAARIKEYAEVGISEFVLSGVPHLEEAYWFGEGVLPILKKEGLWQHPHGEPAKSARVEIPFSPASTRPNITSYQVSEPQIAEASAS